VNDAGSNGASRALATDVSVSVVICCYSHERRDDLERAVASLRRQTQRPRETIVVVDDNPSLAELLRDQLTGVLVVENEQRPGLAGARNTGAARASGDVVGFLDDDAEADRRWIEELQRAYRDSDVLGVGGDIQPVWPGGRPRWFPREFEWVVGCTYEGMERTRVRNLIGANMSVRSDVLEMAGGFDERFGRLEETEFCVRASRRFPSRIWIHSPDARVLHHVAPHRARWRFFGSRCYQEGVAKARLVERTGRDSGLSAERVYLIRTLPRGVAGGLRAGIAGDPYGPVRAGAILWGAAATAIGYARGRYAVHRHPDARSAGIARRGANP
jgi:GT2 family glycosyltransferase